jgi:hypothetical protein
MKIQRLPMAPPAQRVLARPVADSAVEVLVERSLLPTLAGATAPQADPAFAAFEKSLTGYTLGQMGAQPLTLKVLPKLFTHALPPGAGLDAEIPLRLAIRRAEDALKDQIGPTAFGAVSLMVTAPSAIDRLLDANTPAFERTLAGAKLVRDCSRVLEAVWPQLGQWNNHLGLAIRVAETGQLAYLGYRAFAPAEGPSALG